jgi:nucleotide-binding universal stress UspA family protein
MYTIKKILVPTDFSENASHAYSHAQRIASHYRAKIDFIHIIPTIHYFSESMQQLGLPLDMQKDLYPLAQEQATEKIEECMGKHLQPDTKGKGIARIEPRPSKAIVEYAEEVKYDLIVMAARGQHESDLLRGSITEKIIRHSKVPVLTIPKLEVYNVKTILVPTDGSQTSLKALPMAISIAQNHDASISLFHVLELHGTLTENAVMDTDKSKVENIRDVIYDAIDKFFKDSGNKAELRRNEVYNDKVVSNGGNSNAIIKIKGGANVSISIKTVIKKGISAHQAITSYSNEHTNLVVIATHGHSGLTHFLLGSTAEKVAQHSICPILTVKLDFIRKWE